ncbi:MAG: dusA [Betaproteobacteria bacterium]|nr:dusA [Betaproteobacteria bacterium]
MMDWTDRHCRVFHRLISRNARLYTEMVTTGALLHGDVPRHLDFDAAEHPVALQLGGSEPEDLAHCARLAEKWGYDEVNLNCGCPSERVQRGAFGACLMAEPELVRDCVKAMADAVSIPVTVKHRIGIDKTDDYAFVRDFVGTVAEGGATVFMMHARSAWLKGLSPKENREIPPLRYEYAQRLKQDFPDFTIVVNGGISTHIGVEAQLAQADGVMIGRQAYHDPYWMAEVDARWFDDHREPLSRAEVVEAMRDYAARVLASSSGKHAPHLRNVVRHMLGLYQGMPGARAWRRMLSDAALLSANDPDLLLRAAALTAPARLAA